MTEATADFNKIKKEKIPMQHMANSHEDETCGEEVEPGVHRSGKLMNRLSSAQPGGLDLRRLRPLQLAPRSDTPGEAGGAQDGGEALYLHVDAQRPFTDSEVAKQLVKFIFFCGSHCSGG